MKLRTLAPFVLAALVLTACSAPAAETDTGTTTDTDASTETEAPAEPLDLTGEWRQINSNSAESYQQATIAGDVITIDWVNESESTTAIYWIGSYEAPTEDTESFSWTSAGDIAAMENALLASQSKTKDFTYEGGKLMYELTAIGVTMTVEMEKQ
ncbi:MAG TPA: hypothetical protein VFN24_12375 [Microbacterium sp.]|nr:hypothetical protein [Microbacterium sp.]